MSEDNPFAKSVADSRSGSNNAKFGWIFAGILAVLLIAALLLWATALGKLRGYETLQPKLDEANASLASTLDQSQKDIWQQFIQPQIAACAGHAKVKEPRWCTLDKTVSFILADSQLSGGTEALLSFWGEPFMAQTTGRDVPRFIFHVQKNAELLPHLMELARVNVQHGE